MSKVSRFEDLVVWQKARVLSFKVYQISADGPIIKDYGFKELIRRSSVSISSNIAEGFERGGNKEFLQFLSIAKASAAETRSLLYLASDLEYISKAESDNLIAEASEVARMISSLMSYLKGSDKSGAKYVSNSNQT
jgi:four helix bundle protein